MSPVALITIGSGVLEVGGVFDVIGVLARRSDFDLEGFPRAISMRLLADCVARTLVVFCRDGM